MNLYRMIQVLTIAAVMTLTACVGTRDPTKPESPPDPDDGPVDSRVIIR